MTSRMTKMARNGLCTSISDCNRPAKQLLNSPQTSPQLTYQMGKNMDESSRQTRPRVKLKLSEERDEEEVKTKLVKREEVQGPMSQSKVSLFCRLRKVHSNGQNYR